MTRLVNKAGASRGSLSGLVAEIRETGPPLQKRQRRCLAAGWGGGGGRSYESREAGVVPDSHRGRLNWKKAGRFEDQSFYVQNPAYAPSQLLSAGWC